LSQTAGILRDEDDYMTQIAEAWLAGNTEMSPQHASSVPIASFLSLPLALRRRVTRRAIEKAKKDLRRISWDHIEAIQRLAEAQKPQAALNLPRRLLVTRTYDHLIFSSSAKKKPQAFHYILDGCGKYDLKAIGLSLSVEEIRSRKGLRLRGSRWTAFLDAEKLSFPLILRTFQAGDRFIPFGMKGHKKLKDFFVDLKVPLERRYSTPILCCDDTPVWICGFRIDDRVKVTPSTTQVVKITVT